jgi:hypothetical protein
MSMPQAKRKRILSGAVIASADRATMDRKNSLGFGFDRCLSKYP